MKLTNWFLNFDFGGRARRSHMWANWACWMGAVIVLAMASGMAASGSAVGGEGEATAGSVVLVLVLSVVCLLAFIDSLAMTFRRAHDTSKSGWIWLLLLIPLINLLPLYWLFIEDSQQGPNKYGAPVKAFYEAPTTGAVV